MALLIGIAKWIGIINASALTLGRWLGAICIALMVIFILAQVFFRYVVGTALAWPEEASRFLMLWSAGLMIGTAYRRGGLVAIEVLTAILPRLLRHFLTLALLALSLMILWAGLQIGLKEVTGISGRFGTDSLNVPISLDLSQWMKVPKSWQMTSMVVGLIAMIAVNLELMLREIIGLLGGEKRLPMIADQVQMGAE
jgi:TRAP-type C4-dicarboxylate transport system permease small subunit